MTKEEKRVYDNRRYYRLAKERDEDYIRILNLKRKYGLTVDAFYSMIVEQKGRCLICNEIMLGRNLCVDHNHVTGKIRGLLCNHCNRMLGCAKDNSDILRRGAQYLD
jgi:hypothetical protein